MVDVIPKEGTVRYFTEERCSRNWRTDLAKMKYKHRQNRRDVTK